MGFKSPLLPLGISAPPSQGFKSPLLPLGISDLSLAKGFRTPLPFFNAGNVTTVGDPGDCIPWIGSGWIADCAEQHYTLAWICCDVEPVGPGGSGSVGRSHVSERILFKSDTQSFQVDIPALGREDAKDGFQKEIERFESAIQTLTDQIDVVQSEIDLFKAREDLESQLRVEFLIRDTLLTRAFIDSLLIKLVELRMIKKRRDEEELLILLLMMDE